MERPERPSRPEKGARSGSHPYRERHRIASSDSESDMEVDLSAPIRVRLVQRPSRPSVEVIQSTLPMPNSNSVGATGTSSTSSSDPYHLPSPNLIRLRDTQNADSQSLYPFMLKDDVPHRPPTVFYRKRPGPTHFVSSLLTDVHERRSTNRSCTRVRFPSPHSTSTSTNWEAKRFCPGPPPDSLTTGPDPKLPHRIVSATVSSSCLIEPHTSAAATSDRPDRDDPRIRSHTNLGGWSSSGGPTDTTGPSGLLQFFEDNNRIGSIENEELVIGNNDLPDTSARSVHSGIGYRHAASHSSSLQTDNSNNDHPTRASSHILRALDEMRYPPRDGPWLHVDQHINHEHSVVPRLELSASCRTNGSSVFSSSSQLEPTSHPMYRRRLDFNVDDSDNEHDEDSEELGGETGGPNPILPTGSVEEVSDLDDYNTIIDDSLDNRNLDIEDSLDTRNRLAVLTHPVDGNASSVNNQVEQDPSPVDSVNVTESGDPVHFPTASENDEGCERGSTNRNGNETNSENNCSSNATSSSTGNGDDVIILTMSPSPRGRPQTQEVRSLTPHTISIPVAVKTIPFHQQSSSSSDPTADATAAMTSASISTNSPAQSTSINGNNHSSCSTEDGVDTGNHLDCDEFNSKLVSLLECPVCMETIVPPIQQCTKGHPVCHLCRPKLSVCPTCRARFSENRNLLMEKVAEMMLFPCKNVQIGCPAKVHLKDKKKHELSCGFRQYDCIVVPCNWKGFKQELVVHVSSMHKSQVIVGHNQKIRVPLQPNVQSAWVLYTMDEVFVVTFINEDHFLSGCTVYLGNFENAKNYFYEFTVSNKDGMRSQWRGRTFPDKGQVNGMVTPYQFIANKGFSLSVNHSIIEDRDPRLANKLDVYVNVFKGDQLSLTSSASS